MCAWKGSQESVLGYKGASPCLPCPTTRGLTRTRCPEAGLLGAREVQSRAVVAMEGFHQYQNVVQGVQIREDPKTQARISSRVPLFRCGANWSWTCALGLESGSCLGQVSLRNSNGLCSQLASQGEAIQESTSARNCSSASGRAPSNPMLLHCIAIARCNCWSKKSLLSPKLSNSALTGSTMCWTGCVWCSACTTRRFLCCGSPCVGALSATCARFMPAVAPSLLALGESMMPGICCWWSRVWCLGGVGDVAGRMRVREDGKVISRWARSRA